MRNAASLRHKADLDDVPVLLWIDDYEPGLLVYKAMFEALGFRVLTASRGMAGLKLAAGNKIDAVVVDYQMPDMNGDAVAASLRASQPGLPIVLFSAHSFLPSKAKRLFDAFCNKGSGRESLLAAIKSAMTKRAACVFEQSSQTWNAVLRG